MAIIVLHWLKINRPRNLCIQGGVSHYYERGFKPPESQNPLKGGGASSHLRMSNTAIVIRLALGGHHSG